MKPDLYIRARASINKGLSYEVCNRSDAGAIGVFARETIKDQLTEPLEQLTNYLDHFKGQRQLCADDDNQHMVDSLDEQIEPLKEAITKVESLMGTTRCSSCDCTGDVVSIVGDWYGECPYCKPNKLWAENVEYLLSKCKHTIRVREGGGPETLLDSLIVTFINMQTKLEEANGKQVQRPTDWLGM